MSASKFEDEVYYSYLNPESLSHKKQISLEDAAAISLRELRSEFPDLPNLETRTLSVIRYREGMIYLFCFAEKPISKFGVTSLGEGVIYVYCSVDGNVFLPTLTSPEELSEKD